MQYCIVLQPYNRVHDSGDADMLNLSFDTWPRHPSDSAFSNSFIIKSATLGKMKKETLAKMPFRTQSDGNLD